VDLTDLENIDVFQEWDKQDFNFQKHLENHVSHTLSFEEIFV
jgi:hypothetical protein